MSSRGFALLCKVLQRLWSQVVLITEMASFWSYKVKHSETPEFKTLCIETQQMSR